MWWAVTIIVPLLLIALKALLFLGYKQLIGAIKEMGQDIRGLRDDLNVEREEREQLSWRVAKIETIMERDEHRDMPNRIARIEARCEERNCNR